VVAIVLQVGLPDRLTLMSRWVLPGLELAVLVALIVANPSRLNRESRPLRLASLALTAVLSLANAWSAALLVTGLVAGREGEDAAALLSTGAAIWLTNIIAFALWYWQFDRGGPAARAPARRRLPDFQFVQMQIPRPGRSGLGTRLRRLPLLSFTNATAFSPTDTMPLSRWAKLTMLGQSLVSLATIGLVYRPRRQYPQITSMPRSRADWRRQVKSGLAAECRRPVASLRRHDRADRYLG
jgi:hypothetical protein